jgi:tRNA threonylcarbamoyladenosine biosynthesis protein TsaB
MRFVLALEASSATYMVAVGAGDRLFAQSASRRGDPRFAGLGELVARTLAAGEVAFSDIGTIAVDIGPGNLSSIRAAVAYANGLSFSLGAMIFPIGSFELLTMAARRAHRGPLLCLRKSAGGNAYAGLFIHGEVADMRYGPLSSIVPAMVAGLAGICVAGEYRDKVPQLLPDVKVEDTGMASPDVITLYQAALAAQADTKRLVPATSPINEASKIFHEPAAAPQPQRR